ncbi:pyridoxamine 5'-phosphate oxidase [Nocardioides seonyuensis]|uniref:Pyridoxine/pyridoxamine 5'-phosphate oxidase n=1 Tax=Nocardioides seonyuensis TaxID=2518371 RepID=A0A4P7IFF0_9ACTN|nr:pyridoxamine 5'-phosphate oxidase [Nocardioides seonyuensis]QBX55995.1 pyridoxamine 5'-phosphate oxidase [Nocardioides seonyuensis]
MDGTTGEEGSRAVDFAALRADYARGGLDVPDLAPDPFAMFRRWLDQAIAAGVHEPNALVLSTASAQGVPSSRMVLLKGLSEQGFVFFTNSESRKGRELAAQPACALLFPWHPLERQVRVEGTATPLGEAEVAAYFASRPRGAQLGAWASPQSRPVGSRAELAAAYAKVEERFAGTDVPVPPQWGGYVVAPEAVEFWQGRPGRMHDRLVYQRSGPGWDVVRLAP